MPLPDTSKQAREADVVTIYRISGNSYTSKIRPPWSSKEACLRSYLHAHRVFATVATRPEGRKAHVVFVADACDEATLAMLQRTASASQVSHEILVTRTGSNGASMRLVLALAQRLRPEQIVYFAEDDYLYDEGALEVIFGGLAFAHFATGYDHPDKYGAVFDATRGAYVAGPLVPLVHKDTRAEQGTAVFLGPQGHYRRTNSTTMTFAAKVSTVQWLIEVMLQYCEGSATEDFAMFVRLATEFQTSVVHALPAVCSHMETPYLAPRSRGAPSWEQRAREAMATRFPPEIDAMRGAATGGSDDAAEDGAAGGGGNAGGGAASGAAGGGGGAAGGGAASGAGGPPPPPSTSD